MRFTNISKQEFKDFALKHPLNNFYQTVAWGELKKENGWDPHFIAVFDDEKNIIAGAMLLRKKLVLGKYLFYSPRGYLIDYNNRELLSFFTTELKKYARKYNCVFVKTDPYLMYLERDVDANIVEGGVNNSSVIKELSNLGYRHNGLETKNNLQPRWMSVLDLESKDSNQLLKEMNATTRNIIRRNIKIGVKCRDGNESDMELFKEIMKYTSKRKQFLDRPLEYYLQMFEHLNEEGMIKLRITELHPEIAIKSYEKEKQQIEKRIEKRNKKLQDSSNKIINLEKLNKKNIIDSEDIERVNKKIKEFTDLLNNHGKVIPLGAAIYIIYGDEVLSLFAGAFDEFMKYSSSYSTYWNMIEYAKNNEYKKLNFYGISGEFTKDSEGYGLYLFKKDFGCKVVELVGEFDLVIDKLFYSLYKEGFKALKSIKNIRNKKN